MGQEDRDTNPTPLATHGAPRRAPEPVDPAALGHPDPASWISHHFVDAPTPTGRWPEPHASRTTPSTLTGLPHMQIKEPRKPPAWRRPLRACWWGLGQHMPAARALYTATQTQITRTDVDKLRWCAWCGRAT